MFDLSVIIPVRNEEKHIAEVLDALLAQQTEGTAPVCLKSYEILVVDGQSADKTRDIVLQYIEKHPNIRLLDNPKRLSSAARNIGVQNAEGKYVLIVDGHCIIDNPKMLQNVITAFETPRLLNPSLAAGAAGSSDHFPDCLARPQPLEMKNATALQWAIASARRSPLGHHPDSFIYSEVPQWCPASSAAIAYRKDVFGKVGYFDETFDACEDVEFNTRCDKAGLKCWFDPAIAVRYVPRKTLSGLFYQLFRYGRGRVRLFRRHPETFSLKTFGLGLFVFAVLAGGVLLSLFYSGLVITGLNREPALLNFLWWVSLGIYFWFIIFPYFAAVFLETLRLTIRQDRYSFQFTMPLVFLTLHFGFGWGIVRESLSSRDKQ